MCSFLLAVNCFEKTESALFKNLNIRLTSRGPDCTGIIQYNNCYLSHNLLSLTGEKAKQPFIDQKRNVIVAFNGEIYNWKELVPEATSEAEVISKIYDQEGYHFARLLDGEFSCLVIDTKYNELIVATDPFGTKPLYYYINNNKAVFSSLPSAVQSIFGTYYKYSANTIRKTSLKYLNESSFYYLGSSHDWAPLDTRKFSQEEWERLFLKSVKKRMLLHKRPKEIFLPISSGLDSGGILAACLKLGINCTLVSIPGKENKKVLHERELLARANNMPMIKIPYAEKESEETLNHLKTKVELSRFTNYSINSDYNEMGIGKNSINNSILKDSGSRGITTIGRICHKKRMKICISGSGGDELISDYGHKGKQIAKHSNFSGNWPKNLKRVFPWPSFYGSSMETYLMKEEHILGSFGIETRYPFMDKALNDYLLSCDRDTFTIFYKQPLLEFLKSNLVAYHEKKIGF